MIALRLRPVRFVNNSSEKKLTRFGELPCLSVSDIFVWQCIQKQFFLFLLSGPHFSVRAVRQLFIIANAISG